MMMESRDTKYRCESQARALLRKIECSIARDPLGGARDAAIEEHFNSENLEAARTPRTSVQNSARVCAGSEPEVSMMTAMVSMRQMRRLGYLYSHKSGPVFAFLCDCSV